MCVYGVLVRLVTIVEPCGSRFVPVPSAAPRRGVCGTTYGTSRSSVGTESFREHDSIVIGIGTEHADATSALSDAFPVSEGARPLPLPRTLPTCSKVLLDGARISG